ncbi:MAG: M24 family metallopeptidase, partial [Pseudomonadota bacterium]
MLDQARRRTEAFRQRLRDAGVEIAILTDESAIAYLAGFWGYLSVEFGRPTFLILRPDDPPIVLTPLMESEMVSKMTWVENVLTWEDAGENRWETVLRKAIGEHPASIAVELNALPAIVRNFFDQSLPSTRLTDVSPILGAMRMIKSPEEIEVMRQAGQIAGAMMAAAEGALAEGAPEYEAALAVIDAGSRKAAGFLTARGWDAFVSPMIHNLQIMQSGRDTSMVHRRASLKTLERGDPVYFCFCNMAQFKLYKLGFDRMFHIREISKEAAQAQQAAIDAQQAAIAAIRPGVPAESVAEAANAVYRARGYETGYRTGRSIGMSYLEAPELKAGDKTILRPGMTFAVDGGISLDGKLG